VHTGLVTFDGLIGLNVSDSFNLFLVHVNSYVTDIVTVPTSLVEAK
jgi:hypothetical protein